MKAIVALAPLALLAACATAPSAPSWPDYSAIPSTLNASEAWKAGQQTYLDWNGAQPGWNATASGLQYKRTSEANPDGAHPSATDTVLVHYAGRLINGTEFDSSYARNEPIDFPLNRVIDGWTEGVQLMHEGETFEFVIPAELAYGSRAMGEDLPANSTLLFKVELLKVNP